MKKTNRKTIFISLGIISVLFLFGVSLFYLLSPKETGPPPKLEIESIEYNVGSISMAEGDVNVTYEIENTGEGNLRIDRIWTTCGCTVARLKVGNKTSGEFGMNAIALFWSQIIPPGEKGYLEVVFNPSYHGSGGVGPVTRSVYLQTNDPLNEEVRVLLLADVVP